MREGIINIIIFIVFPFVINGQEKAWIIKKDSIFTSTISRHFNLFSVEGHISNETQKKIVIERELAYKQISNFLGINLDLEINIFLFENEQLKYEMTGHKGSGWGFDNNIVEVYNDSISVDPYHELIHVLGYTLSKPPALIDEGLAIYLSQLYGNKPFSKLLGYPTKNINEILSLLNKNENMINMSTLFSYDEIGEANNVPLAYCQSASFVEFLITQYGKRKFLELYSSLSISNKVQNERTFVKVYGKEIRLIEVDWIINNGLDKK